MSSNVIPTSCSGFLPVFLGLSFLGIGIGDFGRGDFLWMLDERSLILLGFSLVLLVDCLETLETRLLERTLDSFFVDKTELLAGVTSVD